MPIRIHDARRLTDLRRDKRQLLTRYSANVNLNMECIVRTELSDHSLRHDIEVLETFEYASDYARISVSDNSKSQSGYLWRTHETDSSYDQLVEQTPPNPGFQ
jgi:hypothetical protein